MSQISFCATAHFRDSFERGFVVIVPDTNQSERVTIEIGMYARMLPWQKLSIASVTTSSLKHSFSLSVDEGV